MGVAFATWICSTFSKGDFCYLQQVLNFCYTSAMIPLTITLFHGLLICVPFTIFAVGTFWINPRLWLHSLPLDIQKRTHPKTSIEKKITNFVLIPLVLLILPGLSIGSVIYSVQTTNINLSFTGTLLHLYGIWLIVHLWDFVFIDSVHSFFINPQHPPIAGTEMAKGWNDYAFHFHALIKASIMSAIFVIPAAFVLSLFF